MRFIRKKLRVNMYIEMILMSLCCMSLIGSTYLKTCYAFETWVIDEIISMY